jgi:hypothetical protein
LKVICVQVDWYVCICQLSVGAFWYRGINLMWFSPYTTEKFQWTNNRSKFLCHVYSINCQKALKLMPSLWKFLQLAICLKQGSFALNDTIQICKNIKT